jgi:hypothetical protein
VFRKKGLVKSEHDDIIEKLKECNYDESKPTEIFINDMEFLAKKAEDCIAEIKRSSI